MKEENLDKLLKQFFNQQNIYPPDDGFTDNVMKYLSDQGIKESTKNKIIFIGAIISSFIYLFIFSGSIHIVKAIQEIFTISLFIRIPSITSICIIGFIIWGIIALVNFDKDIYIFSKQL
jgi:hypothetical protein